MVLVGPYACQPKWVMMDDKAWHPPRVDWIKMNMDGSISLNDEKAVVGGGVHNSHDFSWWLFLLWLPLQLPLLLVPVMLRQTLTLPKPWKGLVDGKTGYLYFWNPVTNVTQYERPTSADSVPKPSVAPISSSVQVQQSSEGRCGYSPGKENDRDGRGSEAKLEPVSRTDQNARSGPVHSHNTPNVTSSSVSGVSSARGHGSVTGGSNLSGDAYRRQHEITVTGDEVPPPFSSFESTGFPSELLREVRYLLLRGANIVHNAGFSAPTPIQAQSWPIALQGRDIVAIAKTGSGKTLGYLVPGFMHIKRCGNDSQMGPTVLVLSPTRELATQIQDEAQKFGGSSRITCTCLYGGAPKGPQLREIERGVDIVVATPGRLNDILEMRRVSLQQVSYLVLDEADRMLDMGFEPQIRKIVKEVPTRRQTLMYTATWPREVRKIAADLLVNPVQVNIGNIDELVANKSITQKFIILCPAECLISSSREDLDMLMGPRTWFQGRVGRQ
ncbi:hypothetical protein GOBAR_DD05734 [Gossypium barbadense]|nr:hypothetical protein GOBAR_DD05734 [Gossypium barbadense]